MRMSLQLTYFNLAQKSRPSRGFDGKEKITKKRFELMICCPNVSEHPSHRIVIGLESGFEEIIGPYGASGFSGGCRHCEAECPIKELKT